jgi:hypothetical protein
MEGNSGKEMRGMGVGGTEGYSESWMGCGDSRWEGGESGMGEVSQLTRRDESERGQLRRPQAPRLRAFARAQPPAS